MVYRFRFCPECRLKVLRAYSLLVGEVDPSEEKGYKAVLYRGLKCCPTEKHIHVQCSTDLISLLIARAEPELVGGYVITFFSTTSSEEFSFFSLSQISPRKAR